MDHFIDKYGPQLTFGGALGFFSGLAVKEVGRAVALSVGGLFLLAQLAASKGYICIDWGQVKKDAVKIIDSNGDGQVTKEDFKIWLKKLLNVLKHNLPASGTYSLYVYCSLLLVDQ